MKRTNLLAKENSQLTRPLISFNEVLKPSILLSVFITFLLILSNGVEAAASTNKVTNIGAIIDGNSRTGKEEKTAMEIAVQNFNSISRNHKLSLHFKNPQADPLQAAYAAQELIKEKKVEVIIGMDKWEEASLVASIGNQSQVPILSFAAPARTPILTSLRWPFLIRMASDGSEQMRCIAALVHSYNWRRVVVVYEDDVFGTESGNLALLTEALQEVGSEIDYRLVLPQFSFLTDPKDAVQDELIKLQNQTESRVFIVLQSSLPMLTNLFGGAKKEGLVGNDSVWIVANSITSFLDSLDNSVISSMEGTLGIKTYYSSNSSFKKFEALFQKTFKSEYVDEDNFQPGIQALRAYDSIGVITQAIEKLGSNTTTPKMILNSLLESDFIGLSGRIRFKDGMLSDAPTLRVVNVAGKKYKELDFWLPNCGFSDTLYVKEDKGRCRNSDGGETSGGLAGPVIWPGDLTGRDPRGWAMPSAKKPLKIVVPKKTSYDKFVTFRTGEERPVGFCIDLFDEVVSRLNYSIPPVFVSFDGLYPDLVKELEEKWFVPLHGCSRTSATNNNAESLSLRSFKGIYIVSAAISAICFLLSLIRLLRNSRPHQVADGDLLSPGSGFRATEKFYYGDKTRVLRRASTFAQALDKDERGSPKWQYVLLIICGKKIWKMSDVVVGDVTILANRSYNVKFTQTFAELGLSNRRSLKSGMDVYGAIYIGNARGRMTLAQLSGLLSRLFALHTIIRNGETRTISCSTTQVYKVFQKCSPIAADVSKAILKHQKWKAEDFGREVVASDKGRGDEGGSGVDVGELDGDEAGGLSGEDGSQ
ncbi:hypothetical protein DKX38_017172 [Salix brachista]|uniref:Receptor ligand binding region domain-containing protein n=1 Tax=Salix brachista TaxID=2182728 RepID=A0A5N5KVQ8_9ROSI|nr:hypothetical protein DKX38_017172 [Salix brachista]